MTTALTLHRIEGEPRLSDTDLAARLGYPNADKLRELLARHKDEVLSYGIIPQVGGKSTGRVGRPSSENMLNEEQAVLLVMFSRAPKAVEARREIISVFTAWRRGELEQAAPKPALPDFSNPVLAARAWADELEGKLLAQAEMKVLAAKAAPEHPESRAVEPALTMDGGVPFADSRNVAEVFGKEHKNVLRDIDLILQSHGSDLSHVEFQELSKVHPTVPGRSIRHFRMTKDGFTLLVMGYTGPKAMAFKLAYIRRFNEMEAALRTAAEPQPVQPRELTRMEILRIAKTGRAAPQLVTRGLQGAP